MKIKLVLNKMCFVIKIIIYTVYIFLQLYPSKNTIYKKRTSMAADYHE